MNWIDGTALVQWADRRDSQALLPALVRQLVHATVPTAHRVEFRAGEGVQLPGWDGYVEAPTGTAQVPEGDFLLGTRDGRRDKHQGQH